MLTIPCTAALPRAPLAVVPTHALTARALQLRADAVDRLATTYLLTVPKLGAHEGARGLLLEMAEELRRDAVPLIGALGTVDAFLDALVDLR